MAGPPNPFTGLGQVDGSAASVGRGRGTQGRAGSHVSRNPGPSRGGQLRGRGRGGPPAGRSGRGRGGPTSNTWRRKPEPTPANESASSPFAQMKQQQHKSGSPLSGGQPSSSQSSPFGSVTKGSSGFGMASNFENTVDSSRDPRLRAPAQSVNGTGSIPVEDAAILNSYNDRFEQLKIDRVKERDNAIKQGLMADPNQPTYLNQAITPVGTCTSMCPEFERVERIVQRMVDKSEKFLHPTTNSLQFMETKMLKRFRRSAAGYDEQLPSDIRTPKTLLQSTNYLIRHVVGGREPLGIVHKFVWDRTRSIRNDFSVQQVTQEDDVRIAVTCLERIARFHIIALHLLSSPANTEPFDRHQEREQLNNTMLSLLYYYDDNRGRISFPNEDEFRAYYIILSIHDQRPDLEARVQKWPRELRDSPLVQVALELFAAAGNPWEYQGTLDAKRPNAIAQGFYARFFSIVDSPAVSYLMGCVAEIYFNHMRQTAIRSIWKAYCRSPASQQHKNEEWTIDELTTVLCFDSHSQTIAFCEEQDLELAENADGELYLNWGSRPIDSVAFQPSSDHAFSQKIVESKRAGRTSVALILGLSIKEAASLGMINRSMLAKRILSLPAPKPDVPEEEDNALFVSQDENDVPPSDFLTNGHLSNDTSFGSPSDSASGLRNAVEEPSQPPNMEPSVSDGLTDPSRGPSPAQPSEQPKTFSSLFAGNPPKPNPFGAPTTITTATPNPFGFSSSPFTSTKPEEDQKGTSIFSGPPAQPSLFPKPNPFQLTDKKDETTTSTPVSTTPQFKLPDFPQATTPSAPAFNPPATTASSAAPFQPPSFPLTTSSSAAAFSAPTTAPSSTPLFNFPSFPQTTTSEPAFSAPATSMENADSNKAMGATTGSPAAGIFNSVKPSTFPTNNKSLFNFTSPSATSKEPVFTKPLQEPARPAQGAPFSPIPSSTSGELFPPEQQEAAPIFSPAAPAVTSSSSIFSGSKPASAPTPGQMRFGENQISSDSATAEKQVEEASAASQETSLLGHPHDQHGPLHMQDNKANAQSPAASAAPVEPAEPVGHTEDPSAVPGVEEEAAESEPSGSPDADENARSWVDTLKAAAMKRRGTQTTRKRAYSEQGESALDESILRASKLSKPEMTPPSKPSLALSSIKPLPKLPILEQIESMTKPKPEKKPEPPKTNQIDEDELLLSAARIAAEKLRRGPSLLDDLALSTYYEPSRPSYSPRSSFSSSIPPSRSVSAHSHTSPSPYNIAYGPENTGLGRSMSRTEQRIRMTGAKGLAYKPLDFTPKKDKGKGREMK